MLAELGYDPEEVKGATVLQSKWRGKVERRKWRRRKRGIALMHNCEMTYLKNPKKISAMCNYAIYLHAIKQDYGRAAQLWDKTVTAMQRRGPDVASVLWGYAVFQCSTVAEEDFDVIWKLCERAREVEYADQDAHYGRMMKKGERIKATSVEWVPSFALARDGYFLQATLDKRRDANAFHNYAVCLSLYDADYAAAEAYFLRAINCAPHDATIIRNFNLMLGELAGAEYDGYEALLWEQAKDAEKETEMAADRRRDALELWAATKLQSVARSRLAVKQRKNGTLVDAQRTANAAAIGFLRTTLHSTATANAAVGDAAESEWEEVEDAATGALHYYNPQTSETVYERPASLALRDAHDAAYAAGGHGAHGGAVAVHHTYERCVTEDGVPYWYNPLDGTSTWEDPREHIDTVVDDATGEEVTWETHIDESTGHEYFYNPLTEETTWEQPAALWKSLKVAVSTTSHFGFGAASAAAAAGSEAHEEYEECTTEEGHAYYYNKATGQSSWEAPTGWAHLGAAVHAGGLFAAAAHESAAHHAGSSEWEELHDEEGHAYYYNAATGETSWEIPSAAY